MDLFIKLCLVILGIIVSSFPVLNECRKIDGYKFPVYSTAFCPGNETEWNERSSALNCTESNGYTCLPNENFTELLEFCYIEPLIWIQKGYCLYLIRRISKVHSYDCSHFIYGCHNSSYLSNTIFKYPACITLGNGCFLAEPFCKRTTTITNLVQTTKYTKTGIYNINDENDWVWIISLAGVVFFTCVLFCIMCIYHRRRRGRFLICRRYNVERNFPEESSELIKQSNNANETMSHKDGEISIRTKNTDPESHESENCSLVIEGYQRYHTDLSNGGYQSNRFRVDMMHSSRWKPVDISIKIEMKNSATVSQNIAIQVNGSKESTTFLGENQHTDKGLKYEAEQQLCSNTTIHVNAECESNKTRSLCEACQKGQNRAVQLLLNRGAEINLCMENGASPLYVACQSGHASTVEFLLSKGADSNLCLENGASPLYVACQNGHDSTVQLLLKNGADINLCMEDGSSPLYVACQNGHDSTIQLLLSSRAEINLCMENGASPLYVACQNGHDSTVQLLLKNGADINLCMKDGSSPLYIACQNGHYRAIQLLLINKANKNLHTINGTSPLSVACFVERYDIVQLLFVYDEADVDMCKLGEAGPLCIVCQSGHVSTVEFLLSKGADSNLCLADGISPLHMACCYGHVDIALLLLQNNANVNICTEDGTSPLYVACQYGHENIVHLLLIHGADVNLCLDDGTSPLYIACQTGHYETVQCLLNNSADVNLCMNDGDSPLHGACYYGHERIVQLLLEKNVEINSKNKVGLSPLFIAFSGRYYRSAQILLNSGADASLIIEYEYEVNPASLNWSEQRDSIAQFLQSKDNVLSNIYDTDSFISLFVFCQVERAFRISLGTV